MLAFGVFDFFSQKIESLKQSFEFVVFLVFLLLEFQSHIGADLDHLVFVGFVVLNIVVENFDSLLLDLTYVLQFFDS
jgi:hypothetical protein